MQRIEQRKITRNREFRACTECRKRKLKCDRQDPCEACVRRHEGISCVYENRSGRRSHAEARLEHLEQLVQELAQSRQSIPNQDDTNFVGPSEQRDTIEPPAEILHNGATHWSAMLDDIEELRNTINQSDDIGRADAELIFDEGNRVNFLFNINKPGSLDQVLSQFLPVRNEVDRLVAAYFRAKSIAAPFIHATQFGRKYQLFWNAPLAASPLWTSILFSMLDIAARTLNTSSGPIVDVNKKPARFAIAAAHCLAIGEFYKPQPLTVEASLLYAQAACIVTADISSDIAILFGTIVRLASIMGYHRDPSHFRTSFTIFEGEMRRRTWSLCMQLDLLVSFQLGLPSNIQFPTWDTRPPTNLLDADFDEDTLQLPPARPDTEPTELLFYIAKHRLMIIFEKIIRHTLSTTEPPGDELEAIDQELRETYNALPILFQPRLMADSVVDNPSVIVTRLCVNAIYQKCLCVLHRRYARLGRQQSVQVCYASASDLVKRFIDVYEEFKPGGQLETERWYMGSITWHG